MVPSKQLVNYLNILSCVGYIHYVKVMNDNGNYAVICDEPTTLGSSKGTINIRVIPYTKSYLTVIAAAH